MLIWYETHIRQQYESRSHGLLFRATLDPGYGYGGLWRFEVEREGIRIKHKLYKTFGACKGQATKIAKFTELYPNAHRSIRSLYQELHDNG